jgi:hypothetical protein
MMVGRLIEQPMFAANYLNLAVRVDVRDRAVVIDITVNPLCFLNKLLSGFSTPVAGVFSTACRAAPAL